MATEKTKKTKTKKESIVQDINGTHSLKQVLPAVKEPAQRDKNVQSTANTPEVLKGKKSAKKTARKTTSINKTEDDVEKKPAKKAVKKTAGINKMEEGIETQPAKKSAPKKAKTTGAKTITKEKKPSVKKTIEKGKNSGVEATKLKKRTVSKTPTITPVTKNVVVTFMVRFHTRYHQSIYITGDHEMFGSGDINKALPMQFFNDELWTLNIDLDITVLPAEGVVYNYVVKNEDGSFSFDWGGDKQLSPALLNSEQTLILDSWNLAGYFENAFYTEPFQQVLLKHNYTKTDVSIPKTFTHTFKVKAPLLSKGQTICMLGNCKELGNWEESKPVILSRKEDDIFFSTRLNLSKVSFPVAYKYGIYDVLANKMLRYEEGNNRVLYDTFAKNKKTIINDGFAILPTNTWKGAGVAIPVFSLRSQNSCGIGEFTDIKLLVDWAKSVGLKLVQILPINDTTATHTWTDSYPYSAISAFALHPAYLNLASATDGANKHLLDAIASEQQALNKMDKVDYEAVNKLKWRIIKKLYPLQKDALFASKEYKDYFDLNKHWLVPYTAFCYFRDKYNNADFNQWSSHKTYHAEEVEALLQPSSEHYDEIAIYLFVQYYLHEQLNDATQYAHENGVIVKGDIPIGIYRYSVDAWQRPELYHMEMQAGAPPDDFAVTGQNWGFPTYNWEKMREDDFEWWTKRFEQMSFYFDAFRIDHILGFFRIWSIPMHSIEGIMGCFDPVIPIHISEFHQKNIWFDYERYCKPYITEQLIHEMFGDQHLHVKYTFLNYDGFDKYHMKPQFSTQRKLENYFTWQEDNEHNRWLKRQLFGLLSNVILFEVEGSDGTQFNFRFGIETTSSFKNLNVYTQQQLKELYVNYFFERQDDFWKKQALQKLPALKRATNMLICGEDLGLVPGCVPDVMQQLGLLSLEIQRMPKDTNRQFFHPSDAPYLSVVTPSTHDMSTIRGWWEEDRNRTQKFFNDELGQSGEAPYFCDDWVNKAVIVQHLYSPAMWSIFQLQDILGSDVKIRRPDPHEERINVPANPRHYWQYRMHLTLEDLMNAKAFNEEFVNSVKLSGRG